MVKQHGQIEKNYCTPLKDFEKDSEKWTLHAYDLEIFRLHHR